MNLELELNLNKTCEAVATITKNRNTLLEDNLKAANDTKPRHSDLVRSLFAKFETDLIAMEENYAKK